MITCTKAIGSNHHADVRVPRRQVPHVPDDAEYPYDGDNEKAEKRKQPTPEHKTFEETLIAHPEGLATHSASADW